MPPIDYTKKATESLDQYNARISGARGYSVQANPTGVSTTTNLKTGVITPADLGSAPAINPIVPAQSEMPVVPDVPPPVTTETPTPETTPTPFADQLSKLLGEAQAGNTAMVGKASDTAALNESQGVNAKTDVINSLSSQLTGLINESKAIPLQIQQSAQEGGANVTKGGLAPIQTAQLRNNAIRSLSVSSQIDAARGDLASAMSKVDRMISAKYGPLEETQKARLANLELLSKDPRLSRENEKRIEDAKARETAKATALADKKAVETAKNDAVLKAYANFSTNPKFDNVTQAAINAAKTDLEVAQILAYKGLSTVAAPKAETQLTKLDNGETILVDTQTGKVISRLGGAKAVVPEVTPGISASGSPTTGNATVDSWVAGIRNGTYKPSDVPEELRNAVAQGVAQITPEMKNAELEKALNLKSSLSELKKSPALNAAVGPLAQRLPTLRKGTADFEAYFNNVKSLLTLENLGLMKGVLSDTDIKILQQAASPLTLNMSEEGFKREVTKLEGVIDKAIARASKAESMGVTSSGVSWTIEK